MKKILFVTVSIFLFIQVAFGFTININPGESKSVSFPQELQSINFSKSSDVSVRTLEAGVWKDIGASISSYSPLKGYIISNATGSILNIDYTYKPNININNYLLQKDLKAGWNLVGVAQKNTPGERLRAIFGFGYSLPFSQMIDFTDSNFSSNDSGNVLDGIFHTSGKSQAGSKYVFENKAYAVFNNVDSLYSGTQNFTDANGNIVTTNIEEEDEENNSEVIDRKIRYIQTQLGSKIYLAGTTNNLISKVKISGTNLKDSKIESIEFLIKKYDGDRDVNSTADINFGNLENFKIKVNNIEKIITPTTILLGTDIYKITFININYIFQDDDQPTIELFADFKDNIKPDNFSVALNPIGTIIKYNDVMFIDSDKVTVNHSCNNYGNSSSGGGGGGSSTPTCTDSKLVCKNIGGIYKLFRKSGVSCRNGNLGQVCIPSTNVESVGERKPFWSYGNISSSCINIYDVPNLSVSSKGKSKLVFGGNQSIEIFDLKLDSSYGNTIIEALYFVNETNNDNGIDADISDDVINNIRLEKNGTIVGTGILNNGKLKFENLDVDIIKDVNSYEDNTLKIIVDFLDIDSASKTDKKVRFILTDIKAKGKNGKKIIQLGNHSFYDSSHVRVYPKIDDGDWEYLLNDDLGKAEITGNYITTRKSIFSIKNTKLNNLALDDGIKTIYKGEITASGGNIELASLDFEFKGFLNGVELKNLTTSGSTHSTDTVIVDNSGNTVMHGYELFIGGEKVNFIENTASGTLNDRLYVYPTRLQAHFFPVNINDGEIKSIELKMNFSNTKENDYFYVTRNRYINWSDLSAGDNHSNITNDWFRDRSLYINLDNSTYTLTK